MMMEVVMIGLSTDSHMETLVFWLIYIYAGFTSLRAMCLLLFKRYNAEETDRLLSEWERKYYHRMEIDAFTCAQRVAALRRRGFES